MRPKTRLNTGLAVPREETGLSVPAAIPLSPAELEELRAIFANPVFIKALANARLSKPPLFVAGIDGALAGQIASNRLSQLQGWALFEAALIRQTVPPNQPRKPPPDDFPDTGRPDYVPPTEAKPTKK